MILDEDGRPMVSVHQCWTDGEAEVLLALLREHNIEGRANSAVPREVMPFTIDGLGKIDIFVPEDDAESARAAIAESQPIEEGDAGG